MYLPVPEVREELRWSSTELQGFHRSDCSPRNVLPPAFLPQSAQSLSGPKHISSRLPESPPPCDVDIAHIVGPPAMGACSWNPEHPEASASSSLSDFHLLAHPAPPLSIHPAEVVYTVLVESLGSTFGGRTWGHL